MAEQYLKMYASCVPVKGFKRSSICDLEKGKILLINNDLFDFILELDSKPLQEVVDYYGEDNKQVVESYLSFLLQEDLVFYTDYPERFPKLSNTYNTPQLITNVIIDVDQGSRHDYQYLFNQLDTLDCHHLQLRFFDTISFDALQKILSLTVRSILKSIEIIVPFNQNVSEEEWVKLCDQHPRIYNLTIHSSPFTRRIEGNENEMTVSGTIFYTDQIINDQSHCGMIDPAYFTVNVGTFTEAQAFNSCLNGKIGVDVNGEVKNCPSMTKTFGRLGDVDLRDIVTSEAFQQVWGYKKDNIIDCRDCEFRYVCTDCRAFIKDGEMPLSKPAKCKYDPYTATWEA